MSVQPNITGPVNIKVDLGDGNGLVELGYTLNGVDVQETPMTEDIYSDRNGGQSGPPIDVQLFASMATIRAELPEYDPAISLKIRTRLPGNATIVADPGRQPVPGCLMRAEGGLIRVLLFGSKDQAAITANPSIDLTTLVTPQNYPFCLVRDAIEYNVSARKSVLQVTFTAYPGQVGSNDYDTLFNRETT